MRKTTITPEEHAELTRLIAEHAQALAHGAELLRKYGMASPQFLEADKATGAIYRRIRELQGMAGKPWDA